MVMLARRWARRCGSTRVRCDTGIPSIRTAASASASPRRSLRAPRVSGRMLVTLALGAFVLASVGPGCKQEPDPSVVGYGLPTTHSSTAALPRMEARCKLHEIVRSPAAGSPEWTVQKLYAAAVGSDDAPHLRAFQAQFASSANRRWIKTGYWAKARKYVHIYLPKDYKKGAPVRFTVCRRRRRHDGRITLYIRSNDSRKSNPPITLEKNAQGTWKVTSYTP